jgi:hypothetical protein
MLDKEIYDFEVEILKINLQKNTYYSKDMEI